MTPLLRLCQSVLLCATITMGAQAQDHTRHHADTSRTSPEQGEMGGHMRTMMKLHELVMADTLLHRKLREDAGHRALMQRLMGGHMNMEEMHGRMAAMTPEERQRHMFDMHERMMERLHALPADEHEAAMQQMREVHHRLMQDPAVQERMRAAPELRGLMEQMMQHHNRQSPDSQADQEAAAHVAERFHTALAAGDRAAVEALLLPEAVVLEGGRTETRAEYFSHHYARDAAFLGAMTHELLSRHAEVAGDVAWVASTSRLHGTLDGRDLDLNSAELLVLRRYSSAPGGWGIAAVHWSSGVRE